MDDSTLLILVLMVVLALLWVFVWGPKAKAARAERERLAALEKERREAERRKLLAERDELLQALRLKTPKFILQARLDFEREYRVKGEGVFGQEMSPLACFGYRVGKTNGRTEAERHAILDYAIVADLDSVLPFLPATYRKEWGEPLSIKRFNRIKEHLENMADLRRGRRNFEVAVSHWRSDAAWFHASHRHLVEKYRAI
jgi:hypothetical protein